MTDAVKEDSKDINSKIFPNLRQNLHKYLEQLNMSNNKRNQCRDYNTTLHLKAAAKQDYWDTENQATVFITIDELIQFFIDECQQNFIEVNHNFATYYLHLLLRDFQDGIELKFQGVMISKLEKFLLGALAKYKNQTDATLSSIKISYFLKNNREINLDYVKEKYATELNNKLEKLINNILQYPESSNDTQLEELFIKMQVFIITNYQIGRPDNHVLLKQCRQALNSILSKGDIQNYVLKKRYHRLEYLQKLGETAAGILIFNNQGPEGEKQGVVRNIFADLKLAKSNTKDCLQEGFDRVFYLRQKATEAMLQVFNIDVRVKNITFLCPQIRIQEVNKFVVLFEVYKRNLEKIKTVFEKTTYLVELDRKRFDCVVEKINEILKYRSAIESEVIFVSPLTAAETPTQLFVDRYTNTYKQLTRFRNDFYQLALPASRIKELRSNNHFFNRSTAQMLTTLFYFIKIYFYIQLNLHLQPQPHFAYLSKLWNSLVLHLTHLVELNKIKDHFDVILSDDMEKKFNELVNDLTDKSRHLERPLVCSLQEVINSTNEQTAPNLDMLNKKHFIKDYCALTLALTGGILVKSQLEKILCEKLDFRFGFANIEYAKYAEYNFEKFLTLFHSALLTNSDLIVLLELDEEVIQQDLKLIHNVKAHTKSIETQTTEMISNDNTAIYQMDSTCNINTIKLANIRKKQTRSTQSHLSFGTRNAYSQCDQKPNNTMQN